MRFLILCLLISILCICVANNVKLYKQIENKKEHKQSIVSPQNGSHFDLPLGKRFAALFSHVKKGNNGKSELNAILFKNMTSVLNWSTFFDYDNWFEITRETLVYHVKQSVLIYTVVDKDTFHSDYVVLENQTALEYGIPIYPIYDGDTFNWIELVQYWKEQDVDLINHYKMMPPYKYLSKETNYIDFIQSFVNNLKNHGVTRKENDSLILNSIFDGTSFPITRYEYHIGFVLEKNNEYMIDFVDILFEVCAVLNYRVCLLDSDNKGSQCKTVIFCMTLDLFENKTNRSIYFTCKNRKVPMITTYDEDKVTFNEMYKLFHVSYKKMFEFQSIRYSKILNQYSIHNFFRIVQNILSRERFE